MSIRERKNLVIRLAGQFLSITNADHLRYLRSEIICQVLAAQYPDDKMDIVKLGIREWGDLARYINAVQNNEVSERLKASTKLSLVGLSTLIDLSAVNAQSSC